MNINDIYIILLISFVLFSAFFSGSETILFSLKKQDLHSFAQSSRKRKRSIARLMAKPEHILITILFWNLFVNIGFSQISTILLSRKWPEYYEYVSIAVVTPVIIFFCEILPKVISINIYRVAAGKIYPLLYLFHILLYPVRRGLLVISNLLAKGFKLQLTHGRITEDHLGQAVRIGEREGVIEKTEGKIIKNAILFSKQEASNIMLPRHRAVFIEYGTTVNKAVKTFLDAGIVRAPVYKGDIDNIVGMIDIKDLLPYYMGFRTIKNINRKIIDVTFFPASKELSELLKDFLDKGIQMAVVLDEFGGTEGVVTLNLILGALMGDAFSKWEKQKKTRIEKVNENVTILSGDMQIHQFNEVFQESLESDSSDTIGGYIIEKLGHFPEKGEAVEVEASIMKVKSVRKNRITSILLVNKTE